MKEKFILVIIILLSVFIIHGYGQEIPKRKRVLVLDAGHGGHDTGALGANSKEKDIVLAIVLKVGRYIEQNMPEITVIYTRKTDVFIPLNERAMVANNNNADLFVSIHANSNPNSTPSGTETFAMGSHKTKGNFDVAKKENSVIVLEEDYSIKYEGFDPNSAESYIMFSLMQNTFQKTSLEVASFVQDEFRERAQRKDRGVKQAGFLVLWQASMPSVLIETGFISNAAEEKYLISTEGQDLLSSAIYRAIKTYFKKLDDDDKILNATLKQNAENQKDTMAEVIKPVIQNDIWFRVQVTSSSNPLPKDHLIYKDYSEVYEYLEKGKYKYAVGKYREYDKVKEFNHSVKKEFPGAFVVAFNNNERIELKTAINLVN